MGDIVITNKRYISTF